MGHEDKKTAGQKLTKEPARRKPTGDTVVDGDIGIRDEDDPTKVAPDAIVPDPNTNLERR
jgi:hypothetical protein